MCDAAFLMQCTLTHISGTKPPLQDPHRYFYFFFFLKVSSGWQCYQTVNAVHSWNVNTVKHIYTFQMLLLVFIQKAVLNYIYSSPAHVWRTCNLLDYITFVCNFYSTTFQRKILYFDCTTAIFLLCRWKFQLYIFIN